MRLGVMMFPTGSAIGPAQLAREVEDRGFESLWFPEHTHIPVSRKSPYPLGGELPEEYARTFDPFVALTVAATVTSSLLVGTGVCLVVQRDPIITAKEVASLDHLSGGRFLFGVGAGWNREEMASHGTDPRSRMLLLEERVLAMKALWTQEEAEFHGRLVDFEPSWSWPKPVRQPHPPVLIGGHGPTVLDRVLDYGDGWIPLAVGRKGYELFARQAAELQRRAADRGRAAVPITMFGASTDPAMLERYADAGVTRAVFALPSAGAGDVLPELDRLTVLIR